MLGGVHDLDEKRQVLREPLEEGRVPAAPPAQIQRNLAIDAFRDRPTKNSYDLVVGVIGRLAPAVSANSTALDGILTHASARTRRIARSISVEP